MKHKNGQWYVRKQGKISGPFSASVISNHLKSGRLAQDDEISRDRRHWHSFSESNDFNVTPPSGEAIKGYLDERTGLDRRNTSEQPADVASLQLRKGERREQEAEIELKRRYLRRILMHRYLTRNQKIFWPSISVLIIIAFVSILAVIYPKPLPVPQSDCQSLAGPMVNWNNCQLSGQALTNTNLSMALLRGSNLSNTSFMNSDLSGADLAYSDLRKANLSYALLSHADLKGANLREADLGDADLSNADLSYADLTHTNISGADLEGVKLDNAIWTNGMICGKNSIGICRQSAQ